VERATTLKDSETAGFEGRRKLYAVAVKIAMIFSAAMSR